MSTSLSASQLHTVSMRDPLNRVLGNVGPDPAHGAWLWGGSCRAETPAGTHRGLGSPQPCPWPPRACTTSDIHCPVSPANLFLLISSILGAKTAGTHTQFVQWFMEECVDCLEQGSRGSILQFMPFTMVSPTPGALLPARRVLGCCPTGREGTFRAWGEHWG